MHLRKNQISLHGFALPTILISSIVMLIVLLVSVTSTVAVRISIQNQYYAQLAQAAGDAGVAYAEACLNANGGVPQWSNAAPLQPNTDCTGTPLVSCPTTSSNPLCWVTKNGNIISSFSIGVPQVEQPSVLVVGGGGGASDGGGGGGGVIYYPSYALSTQAYSVTVGSGGAGCLGASVGVCTNGQNSVFGSLTAIGGGYGGNHDSTTGASSGGSGGGGGPTSTVQDNGGAGTPGQGNAGGSVNSAYFASPYPSAGGGGAGAAGNGPSSATVSGAGGIGLLSSITGSAQYYGGGGGGGQWLSGGTAAAGGAGGGGAGGFTNGVTGTANTGGGGGGGGNNGSGTGGNGGSGVVIVRYPTGSVTATVSGGTTTTSGNYTLQTFSSGTGTLNVTAVNSQIKTIPNSGFVQILRSSNSAVWKTFQQTSTAPAAVPDLCSGLASSIYGWNNAVKSSTSASFPDSGVGTIALAPANINPGPAYFRKDFNVTTAGSYAITALADDYSTVWIDGLPLISTSGAGTVVGSTISLSSGCHTLFVKVTNANALINPSNLTLDVKLAGSTIPIVTTDTSWRVSAGNPVQYSTYGYYADTYGWANAIAVRTSISSDANWATSSGDTTSTFIASPNSNSGGTYPASQWTDFRDPNSVVVSANTDVRVTVECDDNCVAYMDGNAIINNAPWSGDYSATVTLTAGTHYFGVALYNAGAAPNPSGFSFAAVRISDGAMLTDSNTSWLGAQYWSGTDLNASSYDTSFHPNPDDTICSCTQPYTANLVPNPSAESGATTLWYTYNANLTATTAQHSVGSYGYQLTSTGVNGYAGINLPNNTIPGEPYTLSFWAWSDVSTSETSPYVQENGGLYRGVVPPIGYTLTTTPTRYVIHGTAPSDVFSSYRLIVPSSTTIGRNIYYDGFMVTKGSNNYNYADGSTAGWSWTGTPNLSWSYGLAQ